MSSREAARGLDREVSRELVRTFLYLLPCTFIRKPVLRLSESFAEFRAFPNSIWLGLALFSFTEKMKERLSDHTSIPPTSAANQNTYVNNQNRTRRSRKLSKKGKMASRVTKFGSIWVSSFRLSAFSSTSAKQLKPSLLVRFPFACF